MAPVSRKLLPTCVVVILLSVSVVSFVLRDRPRRRQQQQYQQEFRDALRLMQDRRSWKRQLARPVELEKKSYYDDTQDVFEYRNNLARILGHKDIIRPYGNDAILNRYNNRHSIADFDEIEDLLSNDNDAENIDQMDRAKKRIPFQIGGPHMQKRGDDEFEETIDPVQLADHIEQLDPSEVESLLDDSENAEVGALKSELPVLEDEAAENEFTDAVEEVSPEELQSVLEDDEGDEDNDIQEIGKSIEIKEEAVKLPGEPLEMKVNIHKAAWPPYQDEDIDLNKEQLNNLMTQAMGYGLKSKRSGYPIQLPDEEELEEEDDDVSNSIIDEVDAAETPSAELAREYIKEFIDLEDDENTNLANALNLATLAQVQKTDKYVGKEVNYIKKAISDEQTIQEIKQTLNAKVEEDEIEEELEEELDEDREDEAEDYEEVEDESELIRKRTDPGLDLSDSAIENAIMGYDNEDDVSELIDEQENEVDHSPSNDDLRQLLRSKLREYVERTQEGWPATSGVHGNVEATWRDSFTNRENNAEYLNPFLRELYHKYHTNEPRKRYDERLFQDDNVLYGEEEDEPSREDLQSYIAQQITPEEEEYKLDDELDEEIEQIIESQCPALEVTDNCAVAAANGLIVDEEARELCIRHQLCYRCGSLHGFSHRDCDSGFLEEAEQRCKKESNQNRCRRDATDFYEIMAEKHVWWSAREAPSVCLDTCTADIIVGLDV